ncbi:hypothetical protein [Xanthomonas sp. 3058]|uniref:hypothetical protein n=1 Tax=Xanthomonas sp. 3058 TaxID=3035314 RepID=UPI00161142AA|nr:hypothetical protein [Xanthomonas sp. 3058]MBB5865534.1 hypothetical protein [Xanthomonas sp. 3058]
MSKNTQFDWDLYFSSASFRQIRELSPELSNRRVPSLYSPDRQLFYLTSLESEVTTSDEAELLVALNEVRNLYFSARSTGSANGKDFIARLDFIELCNLLANVSDEPDTYMDPDELLGQTSESGA